jgi:uncharacterized protein (DUF169 family)
MLGRLIGVGFLDTSPVGLRESRERGAYCHFIGRARGDEPFCIRAENVDCPLARFYLRIGGSDLAATAQTVLDWGRATDEGTAVRFLESGSRLARPPTWLSFFSYPAEGLEPDVVIAVCTPLEAQRAVAAYGALTGVPVLSPVSGLGAACGECTAWVAENSRPVVSVACNGSRSRVGLSDGEMFVAAPAGSRMVDILEAEIQD